MSDLWKQGLESIGRQFEANATRSKGLFHLMVEVNEDGDRNRLRGPDWFARKNSHLFGLSDSSPGFRNWWSCFRFAHLPSRRGYFRAVHSEELPTIEARYERNRIIRDAKGLPHAVYEPARLRQGYYCGESTTFSGYESLGVSCCRCLRNVPRDLLARIPLSLTSTLFPDATLVRYQFGTLQQIPPPVVAGWDPLVYQEDDGVLIYAPEPGHSLDCNVWTLLLYQLAWLNYPDCPLVAERRAWNGNTSMPLEWLHETASGTPLESFEQNISKGIPRDSFFANLGSEDAPTDLHLASSLAVHALLHMLNAEQESLTRAMNKDRIEMFVSYSHSDSTYAEEFERHVKPLEKYGSIKRWSDERLKPSDEWRSEILAAIERASIAVVLLSANFLSSDFCTDVELPEILKKKQEHGLKLFGVLLSDCAWELSPLSKIQLLPQNRMRRLQPIKGARNRDSLWTQVVHAIATAATELTAEP